MAAWTLSMANCCGRSMRIASTTLMRLASSQQSLQSKERVVILGVGWGGFRVAKDLDKRKFDVTLVSPRNHFLFTPLLPSTTVGTLEFRCVQEPARSIPQVHYHQAEALSIDFDSKRVQCRDLYDHFESKSKSLLFALPYDKLVLAVGTKSNTFGVPGIKSLEEGEEKTASGTSKDNVFFLKQLDQARSIRNRIIECFERASSPFVSEQERKRLLTFVVVGGGPTSIEFTAELCDFVKHDVAKWYVDLVGSARVIVVEASQHVLSSFDSSLSSYVESTLSKRNVELLTGKSVKEMRHVSLMLSDDTEISFGVCVWSTGNVALNLTKRLGLPLSNNDRIVVDNCLRVPAKKDVFAIGDCAVNPEKPLAMLAQVANQQGIYLAKQLNKGDFNTEFKYRFMGAMAQLGTFNAVTDLKGPKLKGILAFLVWRSAYWTMSVSISNKILIPMYWFKSFWFGRDISKF